MRTRINRYTIVGERQIKLETPITIEDVRLIINETKKIVIASSMQKDNITIEGGVITYTDALPISEVGDYFTIEIDKGETIKDILGDANVLLSDVSDGKAKIADAINYKGGEASADSSFGKLAEDIKDIPNFDQWARLAGVLAGNSYSKNSLQGHNENVAAGSITKLTDPFGVFTKINSYAFANWDLIEEVYLQELTYAYIGSLSLPNVKIMHLPKLGNWQYQFMNKCDNIQRLVLGVITAANTSLYSSTANLRNITIGQDTNVNLDFGWKPTNVIAEGQSGIDELNSNLYNNLLTKLYDHSQDGQTRTLRIGWLAKVTQENIDYANSKGWTLTT